MDTLDPRIAWKLVAIVLLLLNGCALQPPTAQDPGLVPGLDRASQVPPLNIERGELITDNDRAFARKLALIDAARERIDLAYYIHGDDYSSSVFNQALLAAARRGVRIRLLVDYHSNYKHLDLYRMLESYSDGNIQVRLFNRPTVNIIRDAAYLSLGCGTLGDQPLGECDSAKYAAIQARLAASDDPVNANIAGSGLVLAGLYGKDPQLLASAILGGQELDPSLLQDSTSDPQQQAQLRRFLALYWQARFGNFAQRLLAQVQLNLALSLYGAELQPVRESLEAYLPIAARDPDDATVADWDYITDFLHHKLLLVDDQALILGGRNIEDAYHMTPNPLSEKYIFKDADLELHLSGQGEPAMGRNFEKLWNFRQMVASIPEVLRHAPIAPLLLRREEQAQCGELPETSDSRRDCLERVAEKIADATARLAATHRHMESQAATYRRRYRRPTPTADRPSFAIPAGSVGHYLENLPYRQESSPPTRIYGARTEREFSDNKRIHGIWLNALETACFSPGPQRIVIHNAYLFLPAAVRQQLAEMVSGSQRCGNTEILILTNSPETTDLNVINIASGYAFLALGEYLRNVPPSTRGARLRVFEYRPLNAAGARSTVSFHAKVMVFGDDLFVGSANADVRSVMMDTNNGIYLADVPALVQTYRDWVDSLVADDSRTREITDELLNTPLNTRLTEDMTFIHGEMARRGLTDRLTPEQNEIVTSRLRTLLLDVHRLAGEGLRGGRRDRQHFDNRFKTL